MAHEVDQDQPRAGASFGQPVGLDDEAPGGLSTALLRGVDNAISVQQAAVVGYLTRLRRARPDATPAELVAVLEKRYLGAVTGAGAAAGGAAAVPAIGTVAAVGLSVGDTVLFLEATALFTLAVAEAHGIQVAELERRRTLLLAIVLGDHGAMLVEKMAGRTGQHWAELLPEAIPLSSITAINQTLRRWFLRTYCCKQGMVALGRLAPLGIGAVIGAGGNLAFGRTVVRTSRRVFGPPPTDFTGHPSRAIDSTLDR